jgi:hypothetical protein
MEVLESLGETIKEVEKEDNEQGVTSADTSRVKSVALIDYLNTAKLISVSSEATFEIGTLPAAQYHAERTFDVDIRPQRPHAEKERKFRIDIEFAGSADYRSLPLDIVLTFTDSPLR